jgi:hypothetical protein
METAVSTRKEILERLKQLGPELHRFGVERIALFGSFQNGTSHAGSDVDLLVEFEPGRKSFDGFMELSFLLEDVLQRRVELVTPEALSPYIGPHILEDVEYVVVAD